MKPSILFFTLFLLFVFSISIKINAQEIPPKSFSLSILGGVAYPMEEFKKVDIEQAGYANLGFSVGIEGDYRINSYSYWGTNIILSINSFNKDELQAQLGNNVTILTESYQTIWAVTGIGFDLLKTSKSAIYILLQGGTIFTKIPDITLITSGLSIQQNSKKEDTFTPVWGIGAGIKTNNIRIGFLYLTGSPRYEITANIPSDQNLVYMATFLSGKLPISIINFFIGITF